MCFGSSSKGGAYSGPGPKPAHPPPQQQQQQYPKATAPPQSQQPRNHSSSSGKMGADKQQQVAPPPSYDAAAVAGGSSSVNNNNKTDDASWAQQPPSAWETMVPDTSALPPPPDFFSSFRFSPANNASEEEDQAGLRFCDEYALYEPLALAPEHLRERDRGNVSLMAPGQFTTSPAAGGSLQRVGTGVWRVSTGRKATDTCLASYPPLYSVLEDSPARTGRRKTAYYEVKILGVPAGEVPLAIGFAAQPYPWFRLPGWHRASVAVHGDDGHRYVNDGYGGRAFVAAFRAGQTVGLGMQFSPGAGGLGTAVEVFFTREGREEGRWNLHEESDAEGNAGGVEGLEGATRDLCAAVGVFDSVEVEVVFAPERWLWREGTK